MTGVIEGARAVIMYGRWPDGPQLLQTTLVALVVFFTGCVVFRRYNLTLADHL
jgi:ABC-type polysaccharide/polyol phosphate export permease